uniref:CAAX prenyl protease 2/Lysostaphin resistance protein A-like domain-containing protein n=1 Tax=Leersia perrieri TaxID=77586 RepID=A0A0D9WQP9_9ORYZ
MSSSAASCLAPPPPHLPCSSRATLPLPSSLLSTAAAARFRPPRTAAAAAPPKGWRPARVSCFRQGQDVPTTSSSDDGASAGFDHISLRPESSRGIKRSLQERIFRFQTQRWTVPWAGDTIVQVMILWIATFWFVGSWIVPFLAHAAGFSKETLTHRGQALYSLLTDITEGLAGIAILHHCLGRFRPLPPGWFEFSLKGRWYLDVALGCLLFPLVNFLSHININLVPMSSGPVAGVSSVEQSIVARDPVAMVLYAVVVTVCAPIWEEIVFRGFLLPSLTRYMPLPWSILIAQLVGFNGLAQPMEWAALDT